MKVVKTNKGKCDVCGAPAAYEQLLSAGKRYLFCEVHVPLPIKNLAESANRDDKRK